MSNTPPDGPVPPSSDGPDLTKPSAPEGGGLLDDQGTVAIPIGSLPPMPPPSGGIGSSEPMPPPPPAPPSTPDEGVAPHPVDFSKAPDQEPTPGFDPPPPPAPGFGAQPGFDATPPPGYSPPPGYGAPPQPGFDPAGMGGAPGYAPMPAGPGMGGPGMGAPGVPPGYAQKDKMVAGLLAILIGGLGIHNFYLGNTGKAVAQLLITVLSCGLLWIVSWVWSIVEGVQILTGTINTDANGVPLKG